MEALTNIQKFLFIQQTDGCGEGWGSGSDSGSTWLLHRNFFSFSFLLLCCQISLDFRNSGFSGRGNYESIVYCYFIFRKGNCKQESACRRRKDFYGLLIKCSYYI